MLDRRLPKGCYKDKKGRVICPSKKKQKTMKNSQIQGRVVTRTNKVSAAC